MSVSDSLEEDGPVFDLVAFGDRMDNDDEMMRMVAEVFVGDVSSLLDQLRESADSSDCQRLSSLGHNIKGSAASVGCMALSAQASRIEEAGRSGDEADASAAVDELQRRFELLQHEMNRKLG